jgi:uracil-DNA glycosylase
LWKGTEIMACRGWLEAEPAVVGPQITVALGAVAGEAVFGRGFRVRDHRGRLEKSRSASGTARC